VVPTSMTNEKVSVTFPNGTAAQIDNPLYDYNFHPLDNREINGTVSSVVLAVLSQMYSSS
jgi:tyrosinase